MKEIPLTQGKVALVDDEDYKALSAYKWQAMQCRKGKWYAKRTTSSAGIRACVLMHRQVLGDRCAGLLVDHHDGDGLHNYRSNIRVASSSQNSQNRIKPSGFKGVSWHRQSHKWAAQIYLHGKHISLGLHANPEIAARAYDVKARELFGEFARPNFVL